MKDESIRQAVREGYSRIATEQTRSCCGPSAGVAAEQRRSCCGDGDPDSISRQVGYSEAELASVPQGANLGLGCGNPVALASLREGETVLDLGSGGGFDCFLAANQVGKSGHVIGVDMTPAMIDRARQNAAQGDYSNVEFRLGEIENLPVADGSVDIMISNCVINLSPDKRRVFREAYRALKVGGRLMVSDIVLLGELPDFIRSSIEAYVGCIAGAEQKEEYLGDLRDAGFQDIEVIEETTFPVDLMANDPTAQAIIKKTDMPLDALKGLVASVVSLKVSAVKA